MRYFINSRTLLDLDEVSAVIFIGVTSGASLWTVVFKNGTKAEVIGDNLLKQFKEYRGVPSEQN
jgi:hypothetical protein